MAGSSLERELKITGEFDTPEQESYLNILRTNSLLFVQFDRLFRKYGISSPQYNILRILRGGSPDGLPSLEIASRMIGTFPDITRLLDRLEGGSHIVRKRLAHDRRVVQVKLTTKGKDLLRELDEPIRKAEKNSLGHMTRKELSDINRLMVKARKNTVNSSSV